LLLESASNIIGITPMTINKQQTFAVVSSDQLYFYTKSGELIDQLGDESGFPVGANAIALSDNMLVIKSAGQTLLYNNDTFMFQTPFQGMLERKSDFLTKKVNWIIANKVNEETINTAKLNYRAQYLTLERIVLDAHSGRILGVFGVLFMDMAAILLILLSVSGIYIWLRYARAKR